MNQPDSFNSSTTGFIAASCSDNRCIAAGQYCNNTTYVPVLAQLIHEAGTWSASYPVQSSGILPFDFSSNGIFYGASCSSSICVAVGAYQHSDTLYPMLVMSNTTDIAWTYALDSRFTPTDYLNNGQLSAASCTSNLCVAAGYYQNLSSNNSLLLAVGRPINNTWSWNYSTHITLPRDYLSGQLNTVTCQGTMCTAAGNYLDLSYHQWPLVIDSTDSGVTWTYRISSSNPLADANSPNPAASFLG